MTTHHRKEYNNENSNCCYIKLNGQYVEVKDGYVVDAASQSKTKLEFFYLSDCKKMVHMDFDETLLNIKKNLKYHKCQKTSKHGKHKKENLSLLCKKIENLTRKVDILSQKQSNLNTSKRENFLSTSHNILDQVIDDSSTNISDLSIANGTYIIDDKQSGYQDSQDLQNAQDWNTNNVNSFPTEHQSVIRNLPVKETAIVISVEDLATIGKWVNKHRDFIPYKGMSEVPEGSFEDDDNYYVTIVCTLNPTVLIEKLFPLCSTTSINYTIHVESSGEMSQEEFAKNLGLTQKRPKVSRNTMILSRSQQVDLLLKKLNKTNNKDDQVSNTKNSPKKYSEFPRLNRWKSFNKAGPKRFKLTPISERTLRPLKPRDLNVKVKDKTPYTVEEDQEILKWVLNENNSLKVNGNAMWLELEKKDVMPLGGRTWQSLRNRFLKTLTAQLRDYGLNKEQICKIVQGAQKGSIQRKNKGPIFNPNFGLTKQKHSATLRNINGVRKSPRNISAAVSRINKYIKNNHGDTDTCEDFHVASDSSDGKMLSHYKNHLDYPSNSQGVKKPKQRKLYTRGTFMASTLSDR